MFRLARILVWVVALSIARCQPLPRPFEDQQLPPDAPILIIPDVYGVVVEPTANAPAAAVPVLQNAMVEALQKSEVPATTGISNTHSYRLESKITGIAAEGNAEAVTIRWVLKDADGKVAGTDVQQGEADMAAWPKAKKKAAAFAGEEAPKLAAFLQPLEPAEQAPAHPIYVAPVKNAPGDGAVSLSRSLAYLIARAGVGVTEKPDAPGVVKIQGEVEMSPAPGNQQHVKIVWHVFGPKDREIGQVSQENTVAKGSLDGPWSEVAMAVAGAARDDLTGIVARIPADAQH